MINEVLNQILQAEQRAQQIKQTADDTAFQISANAQKQRDEILADAVKSVKSAREKILQESRDLAEENYKNTLQQSACGAEKLISEKKNEANALGEQIFGRIINGNC